jgi:hypothetical protein
MDSTQFKVIRNLLSWLVAALFLLIAYQIPEFRDSDFGKLTATISIFVAVFFLIGNLLRALFTSNSNTKKPIHQDQLVSNNDTELNLDGTSK